MMARACMAGAMVALALGCGGAAATSGGAITPRPLDPALRARPAAPTPDPRAALLGREREVWTLEGQLLAEAQRALGGPEAAATLGDARALRRSDDAEAKVRAYLRQQRSADVTQRATALVAGLNRASRTLLGGVAAQTGLTEAQVFMDYLTYEALLDLAMMRYGHERFVAGAYQGEAATLAASFFAHTDGPPSAARGIRALEETPARLRVDVFGGWVDQEIVGVDVRDTALGRIARVTWRSTYEQVRHAARGAAPGGDLVEELVLEGGQFLINYANELDEYLAWNATNPWAASLYLSSADAVADAMAGVAAAGGLEAVGDGVDLAALPQAGELAAGVRAEVVAARATPRLGAAHSRRGRFVVVTLALDNRGDARDVAASHFRLATRSAEYPEFAVGRPSLAPSVLATAPPRAVLLSLPSTRLPARKATTLVLVYDVPADVTAAALRLGTGTTALRVEVK